MKPRKYWIEDYGFEFRYIAAALRSGMSLKEWKKMYGIWPQRDGQRDPPVATSPEV